MAGRSALAEVLDDTGAVGRMEAELRSFAEPGRAQAAEPLLLAEERGRGHRHLAADLGHRRAKLRLL